MVEKAKILLLAPFSIWPPHFGSSERIYNLARRLAYDGRIHLFVLYTDYAQVRTNLQREERWENATIMGLGPARRWAQALNPNLIWKGLSIILRERPDLMICGHLWAGLHALILHAMTGISFVLDEHNAEYIRLKRMRKKAAPLVRVLEKTTCQSAAEVMCVSEADKGHLVRLGIQKEKISVVPNAVDTDQYRPNPDARRRIREELGLADDQPLLLFFGKLDYLPNAEAVEILARDIVPRVLEQVPRALFVVCGYNPPRDSYPHSRLVFTGVVPKIEDYINASDIVVVPLISGGGTKFKIIQAVACGKPVVTTSIGAEGIDEVGDWIRVTDDWEQFARLIVDLLPVPQDLSLETLEQFRHNYSWEHTTEMVVRLIQKQLARV
jgi:glycosyltransferase involved in cell wall biosynthesis